MPSDIPFLLPLPALFLPLPCRQVYFVPHRTLICEQVSPPVVMTPYYHIISILVIIDTSIMFNIDKLYFISAGKNRLVFLRDGEGEGGGIRGGYG